MVDAVDLVLAQVLVQVRAQLLERRQVAPKRLLHYEPRPAAPARAGGARCGAARRGAAQQGSAQRAEEGLLNKPPAGAAAASFSALHNARLVPAGGQSPVPPLRLRS